jgi:hypothetical protein
MSSRWFPIAHAAAQQLTQVTATPGQIVSLPMSAVPECWQLPGAVSYFASGYVVPQAQPTLTIGGEQLVVRTDVDLQKGYRWLFATSSDSNVYCRGPFKDFAAHHSPISAPAPITGMFGPGFALHSK